MKEFIDKLISRLEEVKEKHQPTINGKTTMRDLEVYKMTIGYAKEIVNELAEEYKLFGNSEQVKVSEMPTGWIPCSERLPDTEHISGVSESVLVTTNIHSIFTAEYHRNGKWLDDVGDWSLDVIAWMPLPAPYTEGE